MADAINTFENLYRILHQKPYNRKLRREIYSIKREVHKWLKDVKQVRDDFKLRRTA